MTPIAFHLQVSDKLTYTCRLLRKAVSSGARLAVTGPPAVLAQLDHDMWAFSSTDFVPHCRGDAPQRVQQRSAVVLTPDIGALAIPRHESVLVNLGPEVPPGFAAFARVIEVVSEDATDVQQARQRWRHYASVGCDPTKFDLGRGPE